MNTAIIGLGSNINPAYNIEKALEQLSREFNIVKKSAFIQTKPIGYTDQEDFINGSILIHTKLSYDELKQILKNMEITLGRTTSSIKHGPRTIDLDIIVYNNKVTDQDFYQRDFLKNATLELIPQLEY